MQLIPAFEIGLWNAWILIIPMLILYLFSMRVTAIRESGKPKDFKLTKKENAIAYAILLIMLIAFIYAIFLTLQIGKAWLFSGLIIYTSTELYYIDSEKKLDKDVLVINKTGWP